MAIPILKSVIRTAATQKRPSVAGTLLFSAAYLPICKTPNQCAKKPWRAKRFRAELDHLKGLPTPIPHPAHADHFLSYAEHREQRLNADPDTHQPSFAKCPGRCTVCRYVFKSENDKVVHNRLRHPRSGSLLNE